MDDFSKKDQQFVTDWLVKEGLEKLVEIFKEVCRISQKMKRTNTAPSPGMKKASQATSNNTTPTRRYKSVILPPRHGVSPSNSKLSTGYLRTFGFANTCSSSLPEASKHTEDSNLQTEILNDDASNTWSLECNSLPPPPTSPPPPPPLAQAISTSKEENYLVLSESQLNVLSLNLSEIADKVSPTKYDPVVEIDEETLDVFISENVGNSSEMFVSNSEQLTRFKTPYSRQRRDSKTYVSKQKSFTRKRLSSGSGRHNSHQEMNNNGDISVDVNNVLSFSAGNVEAFKLDSESDSGYSSSISTSISLGEEIEVAKRLSTSTDIDVDDLTFVGDDRGGKSSADNQNTGNVEGQLDLLTNGVSSGIGNLDLNQQKLVMEETVVCSQETNVSNGLEEPSTSFILSHHENIASTFHEQENGVEKSPINVQKESLDGSALPSRTKTGKRPMLQRRRTTAMSFRPPKQVAVQEGESGIVEMDEVGFLQLLTDFKSLKTQLLKLKRELQEADVVSPLMHLHSGVTRRGSLSLDNATTNKIPLHRKRMLQRTMTMDSAMMRERLHGTSSSSSTRGRTESLIDITESPSESGSAPKPIAGDEEEIRNLHQELEEVKEKLTEITQERNSLVIAREELEHELDCKNHTIRMLQKQLESQTDSQDEMAYLKRQVKSLTNQIQQQQQKITELRYRATSPGAVPMGAQKKETVKADIRNRLRDAFVKHLGESSKSNVQLSKYIQKAEENISMAQKGLSSLYSSPHASTEHLPKDKSFQRSDSHSSVERNQEDSDERESESDSSRYSRRGIASSRANRNNDDSGSESGKSIRSRPESPRTFKSHDGADGRASDSDSGHSRRRRITPSFEGSTEKNKRKDSETDSIKAEGQTEDLLNINKPPRAVRKLSRSKLLNKIEASPLSHSWTPGAIEKIVKSWRETKSPVSQEKTKEEEKALKPVSHVQFL